jgi:flagellar biosynthetic protein FliR
LDSIFLSLVLELAFGLAVGFIVGLAAEALNCALQLVAFQAGFSYATTIDPSSEADGGVLLVAAQLFSGLLFFALGLDRIALRAFAGSLRSFPPGQGVVELLTAERMTSMFASAVEMGVRLALPVVVVLIAIDLCLAVLGRFQAQMQLLSLAFPVKLLLSLLLVGGAAGALATGARAMAEKSCMVLRQLGLS